MIKKKYKCARAKKILKEIEISCDISMRFKRFYFKKLFTNPTQKVLLTQFL